MLNFRAWRQPGRAFVWERGCDGPFGSDMCYCQEHLEDWVAA